MIARSPFDAVLERTVDPSTDAPGHRTPLEAVLDDPQFSRMGVPLEHERFFASNDEGPVLFACCWEDSDDNGRSPTWAYGHRGRDNQWRLGFPREPNVFAMRPLHGAIDLRSVGPNDRVYVVLDPRYRRSVEELTFHSAVAPFGVCGDPINTLAIASTDWSPLRGRPVVMVIGRREEVARDLLGRALAEAGAEDVFVRSVEAPTLWEDLFIYRFPVLQEASHGIAR